MKKIIILALLSVILTGCGKTVNYSTEKLELNPMGYSASGGSVETVKWDCKENLEEDTDSVYKVDVKTYSDNDLEEVMCYFDSKAKVEIIEEGNTVDVESSDGSIMLYDKESGLLQYFSEAVMNGESNEAITKERSEEYYENVAKEFIESTNIADGIDGTFCDIKPCEFIEKEDADGNPVDIPIRYRVKFVQKECNGMEIDGVLPGVSMEFDASGKICSFLCVGRVISEEKAMGYYPLREKAEIEEAVIEEKDALIADLYEKDATLTIHSCELVLYSDAGNLAQKVMVPYYRMEGTAGGEEVSVMMPGIKEEYLTYMNE